MGQNYKVRPPNMWLCVNLDVVWASPKENRKKLLLREASRMIIETAHVGSSSAQIFTHITLYKMRIYNYYVQLYIIPLNPIKSPLNHHYTTIYNINVDHHGGFPKTQLQIIHLRMFQPQDQRWVGVRFRFPQHDGAPPFPWCECCKLVSPHEYYSYIIYHIPSYHSEIGVNL
jgi:hypothetical protein